MGDIPRWIAEMTDNQLIDHYGLFAVNQHIENAHQNLMWLRQEILRRMEK